MQKAVSLKRRRKRTDSCERLAFLSSTNRGSVLNVGCSVSHYSKVKQRQHKRDFDWFRAFSCRRQQTFSLTMSWKIIIQTIVSTLIILHDCVRTAPTATIPSVATQNHSITVSFKSVWHSSSCTIDSDCQTRGQCKNGLCECKKGWIDWQNNRVCSYKQSSKVTALISSFTMGITGVDWFVLSRKNSVYILCGILKCLILTGCCIWGPLAASSTNEEAKTVASCLSVILTMISCGWWMADWVRILFNAFPDGNGAPLMWSDGLIPLSQVQVKRIDTLLTWMELSLTQNVMWWKASQRVI